MNAADQALGQVQTLITRVRELTIQTAAIRLPRKDVKALRRSPAAAATIGSARQHGSCRASRVRRNQNQRQPLCGHHRRYGDHQGNTETQSISVGETKPCKFSFRKQHLHGRDHEHVRFASRFAYRTESNNRSSIQTESAILTWPRHRISDAQGTIGALANRLQVTHDALDTATLTISKAISDNQDADLATAISQLSLQQVAVQAASQTFSKIFDASLLNHLPQSTLKFIPISTDIPNVPVFTRQGRLVRWS